MKQLATRLTIAMALVAVAAFFRGEARRLRHTADMHERFATLRFDTTEPRPDTRTLLERWLPAAARDDAGANDVRLATATYWQQRYDELSGGVHGIDADPEPEALLVAANAAFRTVERSPGPRQQQVEQLDIVLQAYASALKSPVFLPDAAYNYEYVVRLRDSLARTRGAAAALGPKAGSAPTADDLPAGPTIHGRPGAPPPSTRGEEFEILTPMEYGDREAQPEPTPGVKPLRKG